MAIAFVTAATANTGNNTAPTVARTSVTVGNVAFCAIAVAAGTLSGVPSGWTERKVTDAFNTDDLLYVYSRTTGAADPTSWAWTLSITARWTALSFEFSGVDTTTPVDVSSQQANASSVNATAPTVDPNYLEDMLLYFAAWSNITSTLTAPSSPGAFTIPATNGTKAAAASIASGGAYLITTDGTATGAVTGTLSAGVANAAILLALKDAASTPDGGAPPATFAPSSAGIRMGIG